MVASQARVIAHGATHVGMKRGHNEDSFAVLNNQHLYLVADGMGGHASGEVASKMAIDTVRDFFDATADDPDSTWPYKMDKTRGYEENRLITGVKLANLRIFEASQRESKRRGMGTTVVALLVMREGCLIGHVGDSRVYRLREGALTQLTEDHSLLNDYIKMKQMSAEEIANFPHKNVIVRALGMRDTVKVDTLIDSPQPGDLYVLCTDGLSGPVKDDRIAQICTSTTDLKTMSGSLIDSANGNGGPDNVTVVVAKWMGQG
ncbi:MAG: Stp1/IreP family PP2C-type Ser/Thr phosphatase [Proteobacteria bacterium]|nr:Stp1/IreP family PP2C-type Ser/Thr phosphatase [Pseudomonadota bacterium]